MEARDGLTGPLSHSKESCRDSASGMWCAAHELENAEKYPANTPSFTEKTLKNGYVGRFAGYEMGGVVITPEEIAAYEQGVNEERTRILALIESKKGSSATEYGSPAYLNVWAALTSLAEELKQ